MGRIFITLLMLASACAPLYPALARAAEDPLTQYVSELQKNPDDYNLREKIIRHVQSTKRVPSVPEEARRYFVEGNTLLRLAKDQKGYELAVDAYRQCLLIAPWWPEANYNFAIALELGSRFDSAVNALRLYIATNPGETDARKAQDKIYEIGAKKKLAAMESGTESAAPRQQ